MPMQHEKRSKAKGILVEKNVGGVIERGHIVVGAYLGTTGPKMRIEIGQHRIISDLSQLRDLAGAMVDVAEQVEDDLRFYGGGASGIHDRSRSVARSPAPTLGHG